MGRPKSTGRLRGLVNEQERVVSRLLARLVESEEALAGFQGTDRDGALRRRLVGARRGQLENAESKLERLKDELGTEIERRAARDTLLGHIEGAA